MTETASEHSPEDVETSGDDGGAPTERFAYSGPCDLHPDETE
jgi:hypothetical protein